MTNSNVNVVKGEDGSIIRISTSNPEQGSINVQSSTFEVDDLGWVREQKRSALIKGTVEVLKNGILSMINQKTMTMPGRIAILEITESQLNDAAYARHANQIKSWYSKANPSPSDDDKLDNFAKKIFSGDKKASQNLTCNGERILRFQDWTTKSPEEKPDIMVQHDNQAELAEFRAAHATANANL